MINKARRNTLKFLGVPIAGFFTSNLSASDAVVLESDLNKSNLVSSAVNNQATAKSEITDIVFRFERSPITGIAEVVIENTSRDVVNVTHVYPGIVHANGFDYDLNTILEKAPLNLAAGGTVRSPISHQRSGGEERPIPSGLTDSRSVTVATQVANTVGSSTDVKTLRSCFS